MKFARLIALGGIAVLGASACSGDLTGPEPIRPSFNVALPSTGLALDHGSWVPNSTNALNEAKQVPGRIGQDAPHVLFEDVGVGQVTLKFMNNRNALAFFEYRIDGVTVGVNPHPVVLGDVTHPGVCVDNRSPPTIALCGGQQSTKTQTFNATSTVDIRLALGGERDWDFDWTRFYVLPPPQPATKDDCKKGGWQTLFRADGSPFRNQGACVSYVNTGK